MTETENLSGTGDSSDEDEVKRPVFHLGEKVGESKHLLVWARWDREEAWEKTGITRAGLSAALEARGYFLKENGQSVNDAEAVLYYERAVDDYGMSGMDIFVISIPNKTQFLNVARWLELYKAQKWQLIREGEKDWRIFKRNSGWYGREIMEILPEASEYSLIRQIQVIKQTLGSCWRKRVVWEAIKVEYVTGRSETYTCDQVGLARVKRNYGITD